MKKTPQYMSSNLLINDTIRPFVDWAIEQHRSTNHFYDEYLPYEFHLRMVTNVVDNPLFLNVINSEFPPTKNELLAAAAGHDLLEDCRCSYNDIKSFISSNCIGVNSYIVVELIYAVTNNKGRNRKERANDSYYEGIRFTPGATLIKLADRIANIQYGKLTNSRQLEMYKKEHEVFKSKLYNEKYKVMFDYLEELIIS